MRQTLTSLQNAVPIIVQFWGVRGSNATSDTRIGNHTSCVSIEHGDQIIIMDSGTGIRECAQYIIQEYIMKKREVHITIVYSHLHGDHRDGLSSFAPFFIKGVNIHFIGYKHMANIDGKEVLETIEQNLKRQVLVQPAFPFEWTLFPSNMTFQIVEPGVPFTLPCAIGGDIKALMLEMYHPGRSFGYRFEIAGRVIAGLMDHQYKPGDERCQNIVRLADRATFAYCEVQYSMARMTGKLDNVDRTNWGHITPEEAAVHFKQAKPDLIGTIHHEPLAGYDEVTDIAHTLAQRADNPNVFVCVQRKENDGILYL